jgi:hypothetical protein
MPSSRMLSVETGQRGPPVPETGDDRRAARESSLDLILRVHRCNVNLFHSWQPSEILLELLLRLPVGNVDLDAEVRPLLRLKRNREDTHCHPLALERVHSAVLPNISQATLP